MESPLRGFFLDLMIGRSEHKKRVTPNFEVTLFLVLVYNAYRITVTSPR